MAVVESLEPLIPHPLPRRKTLEPATKLEPVQFGEGLNDLAYFEALSSELGGKRIILDTVAREFYSPLFEIGKMGLIVRFSNGPITIRGLETTLVGLKKSSFTILGPDGVRNIPELEKNIDNEHIRFEFHYPEIGLERPVVAIAPLDRAVTKIYVPQ